PHSTSTKETQQSIAREREEDDPQSEDACAQRPVRCRLTSGRNNLMRPLLRNVLDRAALQCAVPKLHHDNAENEKQWRNNGICEELLHLTRRSSATAGGSECELQCAC